MERGVMPKEYVITESDRRRQEQQGGELPAIRIGWNREIGSVQFASVLMQSTDGATYEHEAKVDQGQFVDLDRKAINDVIRVLRRARDAAYGRDE